jgi:predicted transcriptional regulator
LRKMDLEILEAMASNPRCHLYELPELSGYERSTCVLSISTLRSFNLITALHGDYSVTEKGKIILAILRGQRKRRNKV